MIYPGVVSTVKTQGSGWVFVWGNKWNIYCKYIPRVFVTLWCNTCYFYNLILFSFEFYFQQYLWRWQYLVCVFVRQWQSSSYRQMGQLNCQRWPCYFFTWKPTKRNMRTCVCVLGTQRYYVEEERSWLDRYIQCFHFSRLISLQHPPTVSVSSILESEMMRKLSPTTSPHFISQQSSQSSLLMCLTLFLVY